MAFFAVRNVVENGECWFGDARVGDAAKFTVSLHFYRFPLIPFLRGSRAQLAVLVHLLQQPPTTLDYYCVAAVLINPNS